MDFNGFLIAVWVLLLCFLTWRITSCIRRKMSLNQEATAVVYLVMLGVLEVLFNIIPGWTRNTSMIAAVVCLLLSGVISYLINRRYTAWLEKQQAEEKTAESGKDGADE